MDSLTSRGLAPAILLLLATTGIADAQQLAYAPVGDGLGVPAVAAINKAAGSNPLPGAALREEREAQTNIASAEAQKCAIKRMNLDGSKVYADPSCQARKAEAEKVRQAEANRPDPMLRPKSEVFSAMSVAGTAVPESVNPDNARLAWEAEKPLAADGFNAPIPKYQIASLGDVAPPPARKAEAVAAITPPPRAPVQATVAQPAYQPRSAKVAQATTAPAATVTDAPSPGFMTTVLPFFQIGLGATATTADNNGDGALLAGASVGVATPINSRLGMVFRLDGDVSYGPRSWDYNDYKGQKTFDWNEDGHLRYGGNALGGFAFNGGGVTPYVLGGWRYETGKGGSANGATVVAGAELWKFVTLEYRYTHLDRVIFYGGTRNEHALMLKLSFNGWNAQ